MKKNSDVRLEKIYKIAQSKIKFRKEGSIIVLCTEIKRVREEKKEEEGEKKEKRREAYHSL
jgi:hypothetical protein